MNGNYYKSDYLDNNSLVNDSGIIDVLKRNIGKKARINVTIPGSNESQDRVFEANGEWYFILPVYLGFITSEEAINYL